MSKYIFIASDFEIPEVDLTNEQIITPIEAKLKGIKPPRFCSWDELDPNSEILYFESEDDMYNLCVCKEENILDDVVCDYEDKIRKKCKTTYGYFLTIRSLKYNIEFDYEEFDIDENREKNIAEWLFTLCKEYRQEAEKERLALIDKEEKEIKAIEDYIKEKKSIYNECTTQVGKKKIISNTVYEIKEKFNNSTVIKRFTKDKVEFLLDRKD